MKDSLSEFKTFRQEAKVNDVNFHDGYISINTNTNSISRVMKYQISINNDKGKLEIMDDEMMSNSNFPVSFDTNYQTFKYISGYLEITGEHKNPDIGNYQVEIIPQ